MGQVHIPPGMGQDIEEGYQKKAKGIFCRWYIKGGSDGNTLRNYLPRLIITLHHRSCFEWKSMIFFFNRCKENLGMGNIFQTLYCTYFQDLVELYVCKFCCQSSQGSKLEQTKWCMLWHTLCMFPPHVLHVYNKDFWWGMRMSLFTFITLINDNFVLQKICRYSFQMGT